MRTISDKQTNEGQYGPVGFPQQEVSKDIKSHCHLHGLIVVLHHHHHHVARDDRHNEHLELLALYHVEHQPLDTVLKDHITGVVVIRTMEKYRVSKDLMFLTLSNLDVIVN